MRVVFILFLLLMTAGIVSPGYGQTFCSSGCPANISIPDNGCPTNTTSTINVTGVGNINTTYGLQRVCVYITHTWRGDLDIFLVSPAGTVVELSTDNGGSGDNYGSGCAITQQLCFDATAANSITSWTSTDPATGTYRPEGCLGAFNNGQNANGTWTLRVCDGAGGDVGAIRGWCLVFGSNPAPPPGPITPNFTFTAPFTNTASTCGAGNRATSNSCNSSYQNGEDHLYQITFPSAGNYSITVTNTDGTNWIGWFLMSTPPTGCGSYSVSSCVDYATSGGSSIATKCVNIPSPGTYYLTIDYFPSPTCSNYRIEVQSLGPAPASRCNMNYSITSISYANPPNGYLSGTSLKGTFDDPDDEYSNVVVSAIPFTFCSDGNPYTSFLVADNGYIIFPNGCNDHAPGGTSTIATPGGWSPWDHSTGYTWPCNTSSYCGPFNVIAWLWRDNRLNGEGGDGTSNQDWDIRYYTWGTSPNRKFYILFYEIPAFGSSCRTDEAYDATGYIMLEEGTNAIEIHIQQAQPCMSHDEGLGIVGLHSINGLYAAVPSGYNNTAVTITNRAWRFTPPSGCTCTPLPVADVVEIRSECVNGAPFLFLTPPPTSVHPSEYRAELESADLTQSITFSEPTSVLWKGQFPVTVRIVNPDGTQMTHILNQPDCESRRPIVEVLQQRNMLQIILPKALISQIQLYDITGRLLQQSGNSGVQTLMYPLPEKGGIYYLQIITSTGETYHYRLIGEPQSWKLQQY